MESGQQVLEQETETAPTGTGTTPQGLVSEFIADSPRNELRSCVDSLRNLAGSMQQLELFEFEERPIEELQGRLVPFVRRALRLSSQLLDRVIEHYRRILNENTTPDRDALLELCDLCLMARVQFSNVDHAELTAETDTYAVIIACNRLRGNLIAAINAVDDTISKLEGWDPLNLPRTNLPAAIAARRAYARLKAELDELEATHGADLFPKLSAARDLIQNVLQPPMGKKLRMVDRAQLRRVAMEIHTWALSREPDQRIGNAHWENLLAVAELLMQINNRHELKAHDRSVIALWTERLATNEPVFVRTDSTFFAEIATLRGRDPELDRWIQVLEQGIEAHLLSVLQRALKSL
jgi:hypothetical protein